jgi:23S rRNA pseudouridine1911/1915/1917 synthase
VSGVGTQATPPRSDLDRAFVADRGDHGRRLDLVIVRRLHAVDHVSRTRVQDWIDHGRVLVDGQPARRASQRVSYGQEVRVSVDDVPPGRARLIPQELPLEILYEDDCLLAVNKPPGLIVHPSFGHADGTLMNALVHHARSWRGGRPSLVNRLDKRTSGIVMVARSREAHALLVEAVSLPDARKEYVALCYGRMRVARRRLRYPIGHDPYDRRRMIVRVDGVDARTDIWRLAAGRGFARGLTLVGCRLLTGRTHQIRVHLRADGLPVVGDPVYGEDGWRRVADETLATRLRTFGRQALHARRLEFQHPVTGARVSIDAPLPPDLAGLLAAAGLGDGHWKAVPAGAIAGSG